MSTLKSSGSISAPVSWECWWDSTLAAHLHITQVIQNQPLIGDSKSWWCMSYRRPLVFLFTVDSQLPIGVGIARTPSYGHSEGGNHCWGYTMDNPCNFSALLNGFENLCSLKAIQQLRWLYFLWAGRNACWGKYPLHLPLLPDAQKKRIWLTDGAWWYSNVDVYMYTYSKR